MRDVQLEQQLQKTLDAGANLWVIGDVHGHYHTLRALIDRLNVAEHDAVVMLGDLIDRGPTSAHVVDYVRSTANVHSIRGNHEQMMADGFDDALFFKEKNEESRIWYHNGGRQTELSYMALYGSDTEACERASSDAAWMSTLPTEIVLDTWRFVHAGYNQNHSVEDQDDVVHMYIRAQFYSSKHAVDPRRTILFGHSPTFKHLHKDDAKAGLVWSSDVLLDDGRPMAIGLDTCLYHKLELPKTLAAYNVQTKEVVYQDLV